MLVSAKISACMVVLMSFLVAGGQTSEGVLANFFNSLLTKKAGSPGPGSQPGGGSNTPGTVRKSGEESSVTISLLHSFLCPLSW